MKSKNEVRLQGRSEGKTKVTVRYEIGKRRHGCVSFDAFDVVRRDDRGGIALKANLYSRQSCTVGVSNNVATIRTVAEPEPKNVEHDKQKELKVRVHLGIEKKQAALLFP